MRLTVLIAAVALAAAAPLAASAAPPRTADGNPDLTGMWTNGSLTSLQRPAGQKLVLTPAEAQAMAAPRNSARTADDAPINPTEALPVRPQIAQGYNSFWGDPGDSYARVRGEHRTSWIVDPPDGRLPLTDAARARAQVSATRSAQMPEGPEALAAWDRCLIGSRGSGGPGMLNNIYNNTYQMVLTPTSLVIVVEMVHDARIVPIFPSKAAAQAGHGPAVLHPWLGDATAWWEGPTLVVETINVHPEEGRSGPILLSPQARVTERLTRTDDGIDYAFTVEDPENYTRPWRAEMVFTAQKGAIYEFACHEGNYAMTGILGAARRADRGEGN